MQNEPKTAVGALVVAVVMATTACTVPPDTIGTRPGNATCRVVEHGATGPEPSVNVGRTVRVCDDGTRHVSEWEISTGNVFATYVVTP